MKCPHCDVSLSQHRNGKLVCHYCGYETRQPQQCPVCGSPYIGGFRAGTQQIEEIVKKRFSQARVLRMDLDTTRKKEGHTNILAAFANQEADILIGTQMIVKGHDFPNVTLVGILAADLSLHISDYRAPERTFQLLTQAAGRAGRGCRQGEVVIQTYQPEHYSIVTAAAQDYEAFFQQEIFFREMLHYPPKWHMLVVHAASEKEMLVKQAQDMLKYKLLTKMEKENIYAKRIDQVQMSSIRVVMEKVEKLKSQGKSVVSLCAGEPDFNTPEGIKKATIEALNNNQTHYSSNRGYLGLRQKVAQLLKEQTTVDYDSDQEIIMTCGCSEAINNACLAFIEPGDEVIIFTPAFVSYQNIVLLCEGIPVEIPLKASNEFQIDIEELKSKITNKTKMMIINNPSNPTGAVYQKETLEKVCQLARENNILILADEIYNQLDYEKQYVSIASFENMKDYTIIVNGFSKAYAMTGWRMGYIASSQENIEPILKVHQYTTTSQMTFAQIGMAKAIDQEDVKEEVQHMVDTFHERRTFIMEQLDQCESLSYIKPHGAFYIMVDVSKTGLNGQEFADKLLDYGVAVVPASGFGKDFIDFVRISFASSKENIEEAFVRIKKLLSDVKKAQD